jgi:hypothetical protein
MIVANDLPASTPLLPEDKSYMERRNHRSTIPASPCLPVYPIQDHQYLASRKAIVLLRFLGDPPLHSEDGPAVG